MIRVYFGERPYDFPNRWDELSQEQYLALVPLLSLFWAGHISLFETRVAWFKEIAGLSNLKTSGDKLQRAADNIYTISRQFNFFFTIDYDGKTDNFPADTRKALRKTPPSDLPGTDAEIRYAATLPYTYKPDVVWAKNLVPAITIGDIVLKGWNVSVTGDALTSTLTAHQFLQASDLLARINQGDSRRNMALLASILYPEADSTRKCGARKRIASCEIGFDVYEAIDDNTLYGIVLNFQALVSFVFTRTHFSILWSGGKGGSGQGRILTSQTDSLYMMSKNGYGDYEQMEKMPFITYLGIVRSDMISLVRSLADSNLKIDEIAQRTKLPVSLITEIIL